MAAHKGPASLRPRCTQSGSSVATIPVYLPVNTVQFLMNNEVFTHGSVIATLSGVRKLSRWLL
jgi:hypothetical protein